MKYGNFIQQSTNAKRYSFILGANESCTTATLRLLELKSKVPSFKAFETQKGISLKDLTDTFSVEALNNEFFKKYKDIHYKRFWEYIANKPEYADLLLNTEETELAKQQKPIRDFVKKMLGRIVFLHFLQKKGWMGCPADNEVWKGGDKNFMLNLFSHFPTQQTFYSKGLTILFFKILNTDRRKKNDVMPKELHYTNPNTKSNAYRAPFLNGGLFDDELPQTNVFDFPIDYFKDLFDFFSQYNFTIDENSPEEQEVGIDPEMLGHIFENLLEENKDKGVFYTPKEIVHYMCQESLIQYLRTHLPECTEDESQATKAIEIIYTQKRCRSSQSLSFGEGQGCSFCGSQCQTHRSHIGQSKNL
jgi:adenine-specific DNA-methyltransferase